MSECALVIAEIWTEFATIVPPDIHVIDLCSIFNTAVQHVTLSMQQDSPVSGSTLTPRESQSDGPSSKITRKSHRKSRAGCTHCKTRRIKVRKQSLPLHIITQESVLEYLSHDFLFLMERRYRKPAEDVCGRDIASSVQFAHGLCRYKSANRWVV